VRPLERGDGGLVFVARDLLLEREARAAARIQHPNRATVPPDKLLDAAYLVSELVRVSMVFRDRVILDRVRWPRIGAA
jgi:hypothetical protein